MDSSIRIWVSNTCRWYRHEKHRKVFGGISFSTSLDTVIPGFERVFWLPIGMLILRQDHTIGWHHIDQFPPYLLPGNAFPTPLESKDRLWAKVIFWSQPCQPRSQHTSYGISALRDELPGLYWHPITTGCLEHFPEVRNSSSDVNDVLNEVLPLRLDDSVCHAGLWAWVL